MRIEWHGDMVEGRVGRAANKAVADAVEFLLEEANRTVPIEEGTLMGSGVASSEGTHGVVSYASPYARRQHEELNYRHSAGRRAKWLERTFVEQSGRVEQMLAAQLGGAFR